MAPFLPMRTLPLYTVVLHATGTPTLHPDSSQKGVGEVKVLTVESHIMVGEYRWAFGFGGAIDSKSDRAIRCLHRMSLQENRSSSGRS